MNRLFLALTSLLLPVSAFAPSAASAETHRFAVVIGANAGDASEVTLRYAEKDAQRIARILNEVGGFAPEDVLVLANTDADEVRRLLIRVNARIRESGGESLLFVFYSGHADAEALHLAGSHMKMTELRELIYGSPAQARILVVDACRSGAVTRIKGGRPGPAFAIEFDEELGAEGVAILTSSAAGEDAQESDELGASFFTHYLASGLIGAGDTDNDGNVSLAEAFSYASERTLAATARTVAGPQHPTYRFDLGGREDLVLTRPGARSKKFGSLYFPKAGTYLVHKSKREGNVIAEVTAEDGGRQLALNPGKYFVTMRGPDYLRQGSYGVTPGEQTRVDVKEMRKVAYAQVVRKGGTQRSRSFSTYALGGVRGGFRDLGTALRTDVGMRMDFRSVTAELRVGHGLARRTNDRLDIQSRELAVTAAALKAFDLRIVTLSAGIETGGVFFQQTFDDPLTPERRQLGLVLAPLAQAEIPIYRGFHGRLDAAMMTYFLRAQDPAGQSRVVTPVSWRLGAGFGLYF